MSTASQEKQQARRRWFGVLLICLGLCGVTPATQAQDTLNPLLESLSLLQKTEARKAAPSGYDRPLEEPQMALFEPAETTAQQPSMLERDAQDKARALSLEESAQTQSIEEALVQFGYDVFSNVPSTFAPIGSVPVPSDYRIAAGDTLVVQLYGKRNVEYRLVVTREGRLLLPEYGPVDVAGLTFDEAKAVLSAGFEERLIGAKVVVTMGELRSLQVRVTGDVVKPGVYTVGALTTLVDALLATGGVKYTGSLRDIQVKRNGKLLTRFDLYDLLLHGDASADVSLQHNDVIFVPPIGDIVYVGGEVQRPGIYELRGETRLGQVLDLAGGLTASASLQDSIIERVIPGQYRTLVSLRGGAPLKQAVIGGDFLRILPVDDTLDAVVMLSGHAKRPGGYQLRAGMRISALVPNTGVLLPNADLDFAVVKREQQGSRRAEILYVDLASAMRTPGSVADLRLQARDELIILNLNANRGNELADLVRTLDIQATNYRPAATVTVRGSARYTGRLPLQEQLRLVDVLAITGGIHPGTDMEYGVLARTRHPEGQVRMRSFSLGAALRDPQSAENPRIEAGDRIYLFDDTLDRSQLMAAELEQMQVQSSYMAQAPLVSANGLVNHPGEYPLESGMRASDLLCAARGLEENAFGLRAELTRYRFAQSEHREVDHWSLDTQSLVRLCALQRMEAAQLTGLHTASRAGNTAQLVTSSWADAWQPPGADAAMAAALREIYFDDSVNPLLQPADQLTFVGKPGWVADARVTLAGEVVRPGLYVIDRGETLCSVMQRAGGVTGVAFMPGAVFTRRSVREQQQRTLDDIQDSLDDLMVDLAMSHSYNNNDKTPAGEHKVEYMRVINQLDKATPSGRMVINLERAMSCDQGYDVVLEDGDSLDVGVTPNTVYVAGQVYVPTSHLYRDDRSALDYLELSGGATVLGRDQDTYIIGPDGEVLAGNSRRGKRALRSKALLPGSTVVVPLDVDRMNTTEKAQSWTRSLAEIAILAGVVL